MSNLPADHHFPTITRRSPTLDRSAKNLLHKSWQSKWGYYPCFVTSVTNLSQFLPFDVPTPRANCQSMGMLQLKIDTKDETSWIISTTQSTSKNNVNINQNICIILPPYHIWYMKVKNEGKFVHRYTCAQISLHSSPSYIIYDTEAKLCKYSGWCSHYFY